MSAADRQPVTNVQPGDAVYVSAEWLLRLSVGGISPETIERMRGLGRVIDVERSAKYGWCSVRVNFGGHEWTFDESDLRTATGHTLVNAYGCI